MFSALRSKVCIMPLKGLLQRSSPKQTIKAHLPLHTKHCAKGTLEMEHRELDSPRRPDRAFPLAIRSAFCTVTDSFLSTAQVNLLQCLAQCQGGHGWLWNETFY